MDSRGCRQTEGGVEAMGWGTGQRRAGHRPDHWRVEGLVPPARPDQMDTVRLRQFGGLVSSQQRIVDLTANQIERVA
jgi:hypothetical protein